MMVGEADRAGGAADELVRRWRILMAGLLGMTVSAATLPTYAIGAFVLPLQARFGWSRPEIQAALLFAQGGCALAGLFVGALAERFGTRRLAIAGIFGVSAGFAIAAVGDGSLPLFYLAFAVASIAGCGSVPVVWCRIITGSFERRRGIALGLALTGTGVAGVLLPSALVAINQAAGWRAGFALLAALPLALALPFALAWLPRDTPRNGAAAAVEAAPDGFALGQAVRSYRFWTLLVSVILIYFGLTGILTNAIPALTSKGMAPASAALVQGSYAATLIVGRLAVGWLIDRFWAPGIAALALTPAALGSLLLTGHPHFGMAVLGLGLVGVAGGAELDLLAFLTARYFGLRKFSGIYGLLYAGVAAAGASGPFAFAWIQQRSGSYDLCFSIAALCLLVGGAMILTLARYPRAFPRGADA